MAILEALFRNSIENPSTPLSAAFDDWNGLPYNSRSAAGIHVTTDEALCYHAVYRGVDLISSSVGKLPVYIERKQPGGAVQDAGHAAFLKLLYRPNSEMSAFVFKKTAEAQRITEGNAYIFCRRTGGAEISDFILLDPGRTWPLRRNGVLYYYTTNDANQPQLLRPEDVIHLRSLSRNGLVGLPLAYHGKDSIAMGIVTLQYGARFFRNSAMPSVVIEVPGALDDKAKASLVHGWNMLHAGIENAHRAGVLDRNAKLNKLSIDAQASQLIEQKRFSLIEISNLLGVPPHKLGDNSRTAYNSLEHENQSYLDDCLDWRLVDWEQELWSKVLTVRQQDADSHQIRFERKSLLRANLEARANYYQKALAGAPWMTIDQVRREEGYNEDPNVGDEIMFPAAFRETPKPPPFQQPRLPEPAEETEDDEPENIAHRALLARSCTRMADRIAKNAQRLGKKPGGFMNWLDDMAGEHRTVMVEEFTAPLNVAGVEQTPGGLADAILAQAHAELLDVAGSATEAGLEGAIAEWAKRFTGESMAAIVEGMFA